MEKLDESQGWNPQQGTMFYWNPHRPNHQFFFNDRDPKSGVIFTVLYDINKRQRVKTFHYGHRSLEIVEFVLWENIFLRSTMPEWPDYVQLQGTKTAMIGLTVFRLQRMMVLPLSILKQVKGNSDFI